MQALIEVENEQCLLNIPVGIVLFLLRLGTLSYILYEYCIELLFSLQLYSIHKNKSILRFDHFEASILMKMYTFLCGWVAIALTFIIFMDAMIGKSMCCNGKILFFILNVIHVKIGDITLPYLLYISNVHNIKVIDK